MPQEQFDSGARMIALALQRYPTIYDITGHGNLASTACPGSNFPLEAMVQAGRARVGKVAEVDLNVRNF